MIKLKPILHIVIVFFCLLFLLASCNDTNKSNQTKKSRVVSRQVPDSKVKKEITKEKPVTAEKKGSEQATEIEIQKQIKESRYDAAGKIDPFLPLISETPEEPEEEAEPDHILTPLEKIDLSQIKLVAIISTGESKFAMVEESSGKGYEVNVGTYIGRHSGKVHQIKRNSIIIREVVKNFKGERRERFHEIILNKQENGE